MSVERVAGADAAVIGQGGFDGNWRLMKSAGLAHIVAAVLVLVCTQLAHGYGSCVFYVNLDAGLYLPTTNALEIEGNSAKRNPGFGWSAGWVFPLDSPDSGRGDEGLMVDFRAAYSDLSEGFAGEFEESGGTFWALSTRYVRQWRPLAACPGPGSSRFSANVGAALIGHSGKAYAKLDGLTTVGVVSGVALGLGKSGFSQIFAEIYGYSLNISNASNTGTRKILFDFVFGLRIHSNALD